MKKRALLFYGFITAILIFSFVYRFLNPYENQELIKKARETNQQGISMLNNGKNYEEALKYFQSSLDDITKYEEISKRNKSNIEINELQGDVCDNLSMVYYYLDDYERGLEYANIAIEIAPETSSKYINRGNALSSLNKYEEALESYEKAIELDKDAQNAYYGKGCIYYDEENYEEAVLMFKKYLGYEKNDYDGIMYYTSSLTYAGDNETALDAIDESLLRYPESLELLKLKGENISAIKTFTEAELFYKQVAEDFPTNMEAKALLGEFYYNMNDYNLALDYFYKIANKYSDTPGVDSWILNCYDSLDEIDQATDYYNEIVNRGSRSIDFFSTMGEIYTNETSYMEAVKCYEEALKIDVADVDVNLNKLHALYYGKRYKKCIEFGKLIEEQFSSLYDVPWYIADSYYYLSDYKNAIDYYKRVLDLYPDNASVLGYIASSYLMLDDYDNAKEFTDQSLRIDSSNYMAQSVKEELTERKNPFNVQIYNFFKENYLYYNDDEKLDESLDKLLANESMSAADIAKAVNDMKNPEDIFTFVIKDDSYDYYTSQEVDDTKLRISDTYYYLRIDGFNINTDQKVIELLDSIETPENKTLVIDLRDNYGGLTNTANNILDALLPEIVTSTLIDRSGYTYNYYSDASQIVFEKIYVLVNENTVSAAELLTLGLKTYLNNVTVIGTNTYGKGVGQNVFDNQEHKLIVYVVNHYWNVRQENIMRKGIEPDIYLKSDDLDDYWNVIYENNKATTE